MLINLLRLTHFIGYGIIFASLSKQYTLESKKVTPSLLIGLVVQLASGLTLTVLKAKDLDVNKILFKLGVLVIMLIFSLILRKKTLSKANYFILLGLFIINTAVAVLWK